MKKRVTGIGGIFYKTADPAKTRQWYAEHLGLNVTAYGSSFEWRKSDQPNMKGYTLWSPFKEDTKYMEPSEREFMINFRVEDLEGLLKVLKEEGIEQIGDTEDTEYGKFAHILDPDGIKIELWEAIDEEYGKIEDGNTTY